MSVNTKPIMAKKQKAKKEQTQETPKTKQVELPGVEREKFEDIEAAAEDYVRVRDKRMALTEEEVENKGILLSAMKEHKLDRYRCEDEKLVRIVPGKENLKVEADGGSTDISDD
jgi:hypothetical protein